MKVPVSVKVPDGSHWNPILPVGWDPDAGGIKCSDPSLADNSQRDECDINRIVSRCMRTGVLPGIDGEQVFADVSSVPDFQAALEIVDRAQEQFMCLDAKLRARFDNNPADFLAFMDNPSNVDEMVSLGLAKAKQAPASTASTAGSAVPAPAGAPAASTAG